MEGRIWAAQIESLGRRAFTAVGKLQLVLAVANGARPAEIRNIRNWRGVAQENRIQFDAVVSEVFRLTLSEEMPHNHQTTTMPAPSTNSMLPKKRHAPESSEDNQPEIMEVDGSDSYASIARHRGSGQRGRAASRRGDARGGGGRGGSVARGNPGFRGRGRGYSSHRSLENVTNKPNYTDYDAQQSGKTDRGSGHRINM